jgi:hypothetical protein
MTVHANFIALASGLFAVGILGQDLPTQRLPVYGGSGGTSFSRDCGAGRVLTGIRGREGMIVDAIGLLCRPVSASGTLGPESTVGSLAGGGGGEVDTQSCPAGQVVRGIKLKYGLYVDYLSLTCETWQPSTRTYGGGLFSTHRIGAAGIEGGTVRESRCESNKQPGSGLRGRASGVVDAVGLECDEP